MQHGVVGKAKIRQLQRHETGAKTNEFKAFDYISAARSHFEMNRAEASQLTMTEFPASPRSDTQFGFTAAVPAIPLNLYDGFDVQSPSRYVIATSEELDAGQWTITAKQPDGQGGTAITLAEYSDLIYS